MDYTGFSRWEEKLKVDFPDVFRPPEDREGQVKINLSQDLVWISMLNRFTNDDPTKQDAVYDMNYKELLATLTYWIRRDEAIEKAKELARQREKLRNR